TLAPVHAGVVVVLGEGQQVGEVDAAVGVQVADHAVAEADHAVVHVGDAELARGSGGVGAEDPGGAVPSPVVVPALEGRLDGRQDAGAGVGDVHVALADVDHLSGGDARQARDGKAAGPAVE